MSILLAGGRSATARRFSQAALNSSNCQWPSVATMRHESISIMGRRRALDLYGTKDVLFTHEQMKRAKRSLGSTGGISLSGHDILIDFPSHQFFICR
ncbi:unnamed protein product [Rotaria socialis]